VSTETKTKTVPARVAFRKAHGSVVGWSAEDFEGYLTAGELDRRHGLLDPKPKPEPEGEATTDEQH
jgi:hypothetical protein